MVLIRTPIMVLTVTATTMSISTQIMAVTVAVVKVSRRTIDYESDYGHGSWNDGPMMVIRMVGELGHRVH